MTHAVVGAVLERKGRREKEEAETADPLFGEHVGLYENVTESPVPTTVTAPKLSPFGDFLEACVYVSFHKEEE